MGLTSGAWTDKVVNGRLTLECDLTQESAQTDDTFTLKTPANMLDTTKSWILYVNTKTAVNLGQATPVDLWAGYADAFVLSSATPPVGTSGGEVVSGIMDDVQNETIAARIDPNYTGTVVTGATDTAGHVNAGTPPYFIINLDGGGDHSAVTVHIVITQ